MLVHFHCCCKSVCLFLQCIELLTAFSQDSVRAARTENNNVTKTYVDGNEIQVKMVGTILRRNFILTYKTYSDHYFESFYGSQ